MTPPGWILVVAAAGFGAIGQFAALRGTGRASALAALALFAAGGWLLARLDARSPALGSPLDAAAGEAPTWAPFVRAPGVWLLAGALFLAAAAAGNTGWHVSAPRLLCFIGALTLLLAFAAISDRHLGPPRREPWTGGEVAVLATLTALALLTRLWRLDGIPPVVWEDEILYLHDAMVLIEDEGWPSPFASGSWGAPYFHAYTIRAAAWLVSDRAVALRLVSAVPGALTVPLLYLAVREILDRRTAFFAAVLLIGSAWAMILARHGYVWAINGFVESIALLALARALRTGRLLAFAVAGIALGVGVIYAYAAVLMPLVVVLFACVLVAAQPRLLRRRLAGLTLLVVAAAVTAVPRITVMAAQPDMRGYQLQALAVDEDAGSHWPRIARQLGQIAQSFHRRADENELFVPAPMEPLLDPITAAAFGLGLFWAAFSWRRRPLATLLPLTFAVMILPPAIGLSSTEWATAWRACGVVPGLFGLAGVPFALAFAAVPIAAGRLALGVAVVSLVALVAVINGHAYFVRHPSKLAWYDGRNAQHTLAVERLLAARPGERVLVNFDLESDHVRALTRGLAAFEVFTWPDDDPIPPFDTGSARTVVVAGSELFWEDDISPGAVLVDLLEHYFPGGVREDILAPNGRPMLTLYSLERPEIEAGRGLATGVAGGAGEQALFTGTLVVPAGGYYRLALAGGGEAEFLLDDVRFTEGFLARGLHSLEVRAAAAAAELEWSRNGEAREAIPASALLRRGLPPWGLQEVGEATEEHQQWRRWAPVLWHAAVERTFGPEGDARVEWRGEISLEPGDYTFLLRSTARASVWLDGDELADDILPWPEWHRVHSTVEPGWHPLRVAIRPPIVNRDLQLFWIDAGGWPGLLGGHRSRWRARSSEAGR